jgi:hypothetical protein
VRANPPSTHEEEATRMGRPPPAKSPQPVRVKVLDAWGYGFGPRGWSGGG